MKNGEGSKLALLKAQLTVLQGEIEALAAYVEEDRPDDQSRAAKGAYSEAARMVETLRHNAE